jgi:hypothetical protein
MRARPKKETIYHSVHNLKEIQNLVTKCSYLFRLSCKRQNTAKSQRFWKFNLQIIIWTCPKQEIWNMIWTRILKRIWMSNQKFEIPPVAPAINRFVFQPHFGKIWPHQIWPFELVPGLIFQGEPGSEVHLSISGQDHVIWLIYSQGYK